jgi:hypothetical protein
MPPSQYLAMDEPSSVGKSPAPPPQQPTSPEVTATLANFLNDVTKTTEKYYTIRWISVIVGVVLVVGIICWSVVQIANRPWWEAVCGVVIAALGVGTGGNILVFRVFRKRLLAIKLPLLAKMLVDKKE